MPYSISVPQARIYPGTTQFHFAANMSKPGHKLVNYQCQTNEHNLVSY